MSHRTAFWILILLTIISAVLQMLGYNFLEVLIVLLIIDSIGFGAIIEIEKKKSLKEIEANNIITKKIEILEKICQDVLEKVNRNPALVELEEKLKIHKEERNDMLDKLSRKTLDLEQKINRFGTNLAEHKEDVINRLGKLEMIGEEKPEEESFSLGELVYMNESEEKA